MLFLVFGFAYLLPKGNDDESFNGKIATLILSGVFGIVLIGGLLITLLSFVSGNYKGDDIEYDNDDYIPNPDVHWVDDYDRSDGTHVYGHWRSNPNEYESNNLNP